MSQSIFLLCECAIEILLLRATSHGRRHYNESRSASGNRSYHQQGTVSDYDNYDIVTHQQNHQQPTYYARDLKFGHHQLW